MFFDRGKGAQGGFASGFTGPGLRHDPRDHVLANRLSGSAGNLSPVSLKSGFG